MALVDPGASLANFERLLHRSMASSILLGVMISGIAVGYTARPFADLLRDHPNAISRLFDIDQNNTSRDSNEPVMVIWPDPTPIKILPAPTADIKNPLVAGIGEPKTVKTYRVSPNGTIIDDALSSAKSNPL